MSAPYPLSKGLNYEYPKPDGVVGSPLELTEQTPKLYQPLKIGSLELPNRIAVSPMCQYTADNAEITDYHKIHYGGLTTRGPGLVMVEATAVSPNAGTSVVDLGIWKDSQANKFKEIVDFAHANTSRIGIQLAHAGRKSMQAPLFQYLENWDPRGNKHDVVAPSDVDYRPNGRLPKPRALTVEEIQTIIKQFGEAAKRSVEISGFDFIEIHGAHGYLINEFLSAHSNKRTDNYGGSFENRIRFLLEIIDEIKKNVPKDFPLLLRISSTDMHDSNPDAWKIEDSIKLANIVFEKGIHLLDISAGGNDSNADRRSINFGIHVEFASKIKEAVGDKGLIGCVGKLNDSHKVNELIEAGKFDLAFVGTQFLENPGLVFTWAKQLGVELNHIQSHWAFKPKYPEMIQYIKSTQKL